MSSCCHNKKKEHKCKEKEFIKCFIEKESKKKCKATPVVSECTDFGGISIPLVSLGVVAEPTPRTLAASSIDLSCFNKPCVKLDFSTIVTFPAAVAVGSTLTFTVFKSCNGQNEVPIRTIDFPQGVITLGSSQSINFSICDCSTCSSECCTYRVAVQFTSTVALAVGATFSGGNLSLTATEGC